jgi:hypothetical protein
MIWYIGVIPVPPAIIMRDGARFALIKHKDQLSHCWGSIRKRWVNLRVDEFPLGTLDLDILTDRHETEVFRDVPLIICLAGYC